MTSPRRILLNAFNMNCVGHINHGLWAQRGRIGWNIVTGYLDSAARAMGFIEQLEHDRRYDIADEFLEVVYQLWEGSWEDGAVRRDRAARVFAEPREVHPVRHHGRFFDVDGYHLAEPSLQRTPVLYQAGSSGRGPAVRRAPCRMRVHLGA